MHSVKGFVCALERSHHGVCIYGQSQKVLECSPLEFECFDTVSDTLPRLNKSLTYGWNEHGYVGYLELEVAENATDELELLNKDSLVVFWKSWFEKDRSHWRISGLGEKNALFSLKPYKRAETARRKMQDARNHRGEAILVRWSFRTVFDPVLDGMPVTS